MAMKSLRRGLKSVYQPAATTNTGGNQGGGGLGTTSTTTTGADYQMPSQAPRSPRPMTSYTPVKSSTVPAHAHVMDEAYKPKEIGDKTENADSILKDVDTTPDGPKLSHVVATRAVNTGRRPPSRKPRAVNATAAAIVAEAKSEDAPAAAVLSPRTSNPPPSAQSPAMGRTNFNNNVESQSPAMGHSGSAISGHSNVSAGEKDKSKRLSQHGPSSAWGGLGEKLKGATGGSKSLRGSSPSIEPAKVPDAQKIALDKKAQEEREKTAVVNLGQKQVMRVFLEDDTMKTLPVIVPCESQNLVEMMKKKCPTVDTTGFALFEYSGKAEVRQLDATEEVTSLVTSGIAKSNTFRLVFKKGKAPQINLDSIISQFPNPPEKLPEPAFEPVAEPVVEDEPIITSAPSNRPQPKTPQTASPLARPGGATGFRASMAPGSKPFQSALEELDNLPPPTFMGSAPLPPAPVAEPAPTPVATGGAPGSNTRPMPPPTGKPTQNPGQPIGRPLNASGNTPIPGPKPGPGPAGTNTPIPAPRNIPPPIAKQPESGGQPVPQPGPGQNMPPQGLKGSGSIPAGRPLSGGPARPPRASLPPGSVAPIPINTSTPTPVGAGSRPPTQGSPAPSGATPSGIPPQGQRNSTGPAQPVQGPSGAGGAGAGAPQGRPSPAPRPKSAYMPKAGTVVPPAALAGSGSPGPQRPAGAGGPAAGPRPIAKTPGPMAKPAGPVGISAPIYEERDPGKESILRVFFKDGTFRSVCTRSNSTAKDVYESICSKFKESDLSDHCLFHIRGSQQRRLQDNEYVLALNDSFSNPGDKLQFKHQEDVATSRKKVLRIYFTDNTFKSFQATSDDTVHTMTQQVASKLKLTPAGYSLYTMKDQVPSKLNDTDLVIDVQESWPTGTIFVFANTMPIMKSGFQVEPEDLKPVEKPSEEDSEPEPQVQEYRKPSFKPSHHMVGNVPQGMNMRGIAEGAANLRSAGGLRSVGNPMQRKHNETMQIQAFTQWMDFHMAKRDYYIQNLETDLCDGVLLINLMELLTGADLGAYLDQPDMTISEKMANVNKALRHMQDVGLPRENANCAEDVLDGNVRLLIALLWPVIYSSSVTPFNPRIGEAAAKKEIITWAQNTVSPVRNTIRIENLEASWADGVAICAIVSRYRPDILKFESVASLSREKRVETILQLLEEQLGMPPIIQAASLNSNFPPEERSMFAFLVALRERLTAT